jgi:hypothetical protein
VINCNINASPEGLPRCRYTYNGADYLIPFSSGKWDNKYPENLVDPVLIKEVKP